MFLCPKIQTTKNILRTTWKIDLTGQPGQQSLFHALNICHCNWWNSQTKGFFQFEIIINVLVSSFWFIWIPMLGGAHGLKNESNELRIAYS